MQTSHETSLPKCYFDEFDNLVSENELLKKGILCEVSFGYIFIKTVILLPKYHLKVCGPPGVGKTQFLFQICSSYLLAHEDLDETIIYIDTENNFSTKRWIFRLKITFSLKS